MSNIKNIIIFLAIATGLILIYFFFIKAPADTGSLVSSTSVSTTSDSVTDSTPAVAKDFLDLLLSVRNIKLDDKIFSEDAFVNLHDSSITLIPDGNEGRPNPFAPIGSDIVTAPLSIIPVTTIPDTTTTTAPIKKP